LFLSFVGITFAQKKSTKKTKKPAAKTAAKADTAAASNTTVKVSQTALADTKKDTVKQAALDRPLDGYYAQTNTLTAKPVVYASIRQADVFFRMRIWREIDLREKMNQYMASPKARLIDVLMDAIKAGELRAFDATPTKEFPDGDEFAYPLTPTEAYRKMADSVLITLTDRNTGDQTGVKKVMGEFSPDSVVRFRIKEDYMFDKERSVMEVRIIGIAPLIQLKTAGTSFDYQPAFWIYFPEARPILAAREVTMNGNDAVNLNYDQVFLKRIFSSYIVKESNIKDERIKDYAQGIDRLYESERIKKELLDYELNLWQY
jgi:gliding motility associated protien GldN